MSNKKYTLPYTKGNQTDIKSKIQAVNTIMGDDLSYGSVNSKAIMAINNYTAECGGIGVVTLIERQSINTVDFDDNEWSKTIKLSIQQDGEMKCFNDNFESFVRIWVKDTKLLDVDYRPLRDDYISSHLYSVILQGLLHSRFKRVSWDELLEDFSHECDLYNVHYLYYKYGVLCYGFGQLRVNVATLRYAYSSPEVVPCGLTKDREVIMDNFQIERARAEMRHDIGVEVSRIVEYWKGDPDQTLNITQDIQHDGREFS